MRKTGGREDGSAGSLSSDENLLVAHDCGFAGSGGFGFRIWDFELVWDFDIGISDFSFWLRPRPR